MITATLTHPPSMTGDNGGEDDDDDDEGVSKSNYHLEIGYFTTPPDEGWVVLKMPLPPGRMSEEQVATFQLLSEQ